ncbi:preprotein translocase subunit SecG [Parvularcula oceani]|uniref:preprotein translocase subunit SecG n=1 Tax=Parvularcula oceani TaxID=1247963 RepID=UPI00068E45A7|nr:preprotein translocase subunit SecG [Parvularcula oceani]
MTAILLAIHTIIVIALIGVVLLQRSEGGALGMSGGGGGFMSGRGAANALTRTTTALGGLFFATSLALALTADRGVDQDEIFRDLTGEDGTSRAIDAGDLRQEDVLDVFGTDDPEVQEAPALPDEAGAPEAAVPDLDDAGLEPEGAAPEGE